MRRFVLLLLFVIAGAIAGAPFVCGLLFKQEMMKLVDVINNAGVLQLSVVDYQRGWATSHAKIKIEPGDVFKNNPSMKSMVAAGNNTSLVIEINIQHGPLIHNLIEKRYALAYGSMSGFISLPEKIETSLYGKKSENGFLQFDVISSFGGNWFSQYKIPSMTPPPIMPDVTARWDGLDAVFHVDVTQHELEKYYTKVNFKALDVTVKKEGASGMFPNVNMQPITYENSMNNEHGHAFESVLSVPSIVVADSNPVLLLKNFKQEFTQKSNESDNMLNIYFAQTLDTLNFSAYLPVQLNKSGIYLNVKNLNSKEFNDFYSYTTSIKRAMTEEELNKLQLMIPKIISPSSYMTVDVGLTAPEGVLIMNSKLSWPQLLSGQMNMQTLLMSANATMAMRISIPLVDKIIQMYFGTPATAQAMPAGNPQSAQMPANGQAGQQLNPAQMAQKIIQTYLQDGYLIKDNNDYVTSIVYQNGSIKANGHDFKP